MSFYILNDNVNSNYNSQYSKISRNKQTSSYSLFSNNKNAVSFLGKLSGKICTDIFKKCADVSNAELIPLPSAVNTLSDVVMSNEMKSDFILASSFESNSTALNISKKAILLLKELLPFYKSDEKTLLSYLYSCKNNDQKIFLSDKFKSSINKGMRPSVCIWRKSTVGRNTTPYVEVQKLNQIRAAVNESAREVSFNEEDFFRPLSSIADEILSQLKKEFVKSREIPYELFSKMENSLLKKRFDLKQIYKEYYGNLKECKTFKDLKSTYPELYDEIKIPDFFIQQLKKNFGFTDANSFKKVVLDALKQGYIDFIPKSMMKLILPNNLVKSPMLLQLHGIYIPLPSESFIELLNNSSSFNSKFMNIPNLTEFEVVKLADRYAKDKSGYFNFENLVKMDIPAEWLPVKYINDYRAVGIKEFPTKTLINRFLYNCVKDGVNLKEPNPLKQYEEIKTLTPEMKDIVDKVYMPLINKEKMDSYIFKNMKKEHKDFDWRETAKSFEHLKELYVEDFWRTFNTPARVQKYEDFFEEAKNLINEKFEFRNRLTKKDSP